MQHDIPSIWHRIEAVLSKHLPEAAKTLAPPASDPDIERLESCIELRLPDPFKESLRVHNGQNDPTGCHAFSSQGIFSSTQEIAETWKMLTELDERFRQFASVWGFGAWWTRNWVRFTHMEGDALCINLDPTLGDRLGPADWAKPAKMTHESDKWR